MKTFQKLQLVKKIITQLQLFQKHYKMIAIDLSKQQALDADPNAIQQINFTENLSGNNNRLMFFIIEEVKKAILDLPQGTFKVL